MLAFAYLCVFFYCFPIFFLVFPNLEKWNCLSIYNLRLYVYIYIYECCLSVSTESTVFAQLIKTSLCSRVVACVRFGVCIDPQTTSSDYTANECLLNRSAANSRQPRSRRSLLLIHSQLWPLARSSGVWPWHSRRKQLEGKGANPATGF